jgi:hypothetical protein
MFGIQLLNSLDTNDVVHHEDTAIQEPHLGSIWFDHPDHGFVRRLLRLSNLGRIWKAHPKHGILQQSARLLLYQHNMYDTTLDAQALL